MFKSIDKTKKVCYNVKVENIGVSPSGKASDSDSDITGVRIPAPQPKNKGYQSVSFVFLCNVFKHRLTSETHEMERAHFTRRSKSSLF